MGTFSGLTGDRALQLLYSCVKAPLLLLFSFAVSLPSFFVLNSLCGLRRDFAEAVRALAATQAGLTVILASFAPFTALWYLSSADYSAAVAFNGVMFAAASGTAQLLLQRYYSPLIRRSPRHRWMLAAWLVLYCFVAIQLAWVLRPFIGDPNRPPQFFRPDAFQENAYEVVVRLMWSLVMAAGRSGGKINGTCPFGNGVLIPHFHSATRLSLFRNFPFFNYEL
jgi:hypothetical protein